MSEWTTRLAKLSVKEREWLCEMQPFLDKYNSTTIIFASGKLFRQSSYLFTVGFWVGASNRDMCLNIRKKLGMKAGEFEDKRFNFPIRH
jgi:hypothetical protein